MTSLEVGHRCALTTSILGRVERKAAAAASLWACARSVEGLRKLRAGNQQSAECEDSQAESILVDIVIQLERLLGLGLEVFLGRVGSVVVFEQLGLPPALECVDHCEDGYGSGAAVQRCSGAVVQWYSGTAVSTMCPCTGVGGGNWARDVEAGRALAAGGVVEGCL